ncbi:uncharacterized protein LY79DRAFT_661782 [Colletotrichum navitas]|uniref:Uncharacterized protein n=1 Tax=Colletotrichum navitas TaxID=681940 RepID=A0AAD8PSL4_9PEZI|nr:uncharacterized protein LY79DRAFT_661782 [Colletotrichum navitas]KAK1579435.1 hypothetical protein LY79DRAFT_661782 [Colletotrichum navitas]
MTTVSSWSSALPQSYQSATASLNPCEKTLSGATIARPPDVALLPNGRVEVLVRVNEEQQVGAPQAVRHVLDVIEGGLVNLEGFGLLVVQGLDVVGRTVSIPRDNLEEHELDIPDVLLAIILRLQAYWWMGTQD